ncbi:MAG TPA: PQQ-binding-like beta-propeller repeat protein [Steroidobacteraceae bacterium]|nr:PQQ-binding-like beta-propeller repeat protein [Steroidobacteraceae bacterium]
MAISSRRQRGWRIAAGLVLAVGASTIGSSAQAPADRWWAGYGNGADNSRFFASRQISKTNVANLEVAWTYPHGDTGFGSIVVHGVAYGRGRGGSLVAVDAATGKELWIRENMQGMTSRGFNYWESADGRDRRLIFAMDSLLQQVDARTGKSITSFGRGGVVDLREGIDGRDPASIGAIQSNTPGEVFENLLILGSAPGEGYMSPPGDIRAYDVLTGKLVWTFHTVPRPGEFGYDTWPKDAWRYIGGVNNWGEMTIDARRGTVYIPLGSPSYDFFGADRIGANLFGTSLVALDARTGKRRWHFQMVHHDLWDMDPSAAPQLTTIRDGSRQREVVAIAGKTGWLYVFDRDTGEPVWPVEERPVPKSTMPGEQSWPTQPYPTKPEPFSKHTFTVDDISPYLTEAEATTFRQRLLGAKNLGLFTPISLEDTVHVPTSNGGALFGGMASEPTTGAVYVIAHDNPGILKLLDPDAQPRRGGGGPPVQPGQVLFQANCQVCHGADRRGTDTGVPLVHLAADPANNIVAGAPRFDATQIRAILATGKGRMPSYPHLAATDVDLLVRYLTAPPGGPGGGFGPGRGGGGGGASPAPRELVAGSGSVAQRPQAARGPATTYPEGAPAEWKQYTINEYNTVGNRIKPPFTSIVKYDLNSPRIQWRIGFGDDPELAARGITGTGTPGLLNGVIVTASGLVFGAGRDNQIRAWDSDSGKQLWSARFGGDFVGSPVMYEMNGRQYLLVPAASTPRRGPGAPAAAPAGAAGGAEAPLGWVAYALPAQAN